MYNSSLPCRETTDIVAIILDRDVAVDVEEKLMLASVSKIFFMIY